MDNIYSKFFQKKTNTNIELELIKKDLSPNEIPTVPEYIKVLIQKILKLIMNSIIKKNLLLMVNISNDIKE